MPSQEELRAHLEALFVAGLPEPHNQSLSGETTVPPPGASLEALTASSDRRLAAAAKRRLEELSNLPPADQEALQLPAETASVTEQSIEERVKNAGSMTTGLPDDYVYGE